MLLALTSLIDFVGMCICLWLAVYLLARGFPSRITLSAVVVLCALSLFFLGAYINVQYQIPGTAAWRAALVTIGMMAWYNTTYRLLPIASQKAMSWMARGIFIFGLITVVLLIGGNAFTGEGGNPLGVAQMTLGLPYIIYGAFQCLCAGATLYNFRRGAPVGVGPQPRFFLAASILAATTIGYGVVALIASPRLPRLIQDGLLLSAVGLLGYSVARHQALVERRTTLQDFPISAVTIFGLSAIYATVSWQVGFSAVWVAIITLLAILTHSVHDVAREFLSHLFHRREGDLRRKLRWLAHHASAQDILQASLQQGLTDLCRTLSAKSGFIAVRQDQHFVVLTSFNSLGEGSLLQASDTTCDDLFQPSTALGEKAAWLAPAFVRGEQTAVIGLGPRANQTSYLQSDLDLLAELADWVGLMLATQTQQQTSQEQLDQLATEMQLQELGLQSGAKELEAVFATGPDVEFVREVEEGLRKLSDYTTLGQSALAARLIGIGDTQVERGKNIRQRLVQAVEGLRPADEYPQNLLPREWYSYVILHDAYIEEVPNREIMTRLYISEGTFSRLRRKAIRSVAQSIIEMKGANVTPQ